MERQRRGRTGKGRQNHCPPRAGQAGGDRASSFRGSQGRAVKRTEEKALNLFFFLLEEEGGRHFKTWRQIYHCAFCALGG